MDVNHRGGCVRNDCSLPIVSSSARILLVDHIPVSLVKTASLLQEQFYNVTTAESGSVALKLFEAWNGHYDIVLADFYMEDMTIYEFIQSIRDKCLRSDLPIIVMAKDYPVDLGMKVLRKGASFFIEKPLTPTDIAYLWQKVVYFRGITPGVTSTKQKKRGFSGSYEGNGKRRKNQNAQGRVTFAEAAAKKTSNMRNVEHAYLQSCSYLQKDNGGVLFRSTGAPFQQILNEINSNIALNGPTENVTLNTGRLHVGGGNGEVQMQGCQLTPANGYMTSVNLQVRNQDDSDNLSRRIYFSGNRGNLGNYGTGIHQLSGGKQITFQGGQVIPENGYATGALQFPNLEASGGCNANAGGVTFTEAGQSKTSNMRNDEHGYLLSSSDLQKDNGGVHLSSTSPGIQQNLNELNSNIEMNGPTENVIMNTGRVQVAGKNGAFEMQGGQRTPANGYITGVLPVGNQTASGDLGRAIYVNGNTGNLGNCSTGSHHVAGGNQIILQGEVTLDNGYVTGPPQVPNPEASGDCNANTGSLGYMNTGQGISIDDTTEVELTAEDIADMVRSVQV